MKLYDELVWRGLIKDISSPELEEKLNNGGMSFYIGTDPTADSLHVGHLSSFLISKRLKDAYNLDPTTQIQVLCPSKKGDTGTMNLNKVLQDEIYNKGNRARVVCVNRHMNINL